MKKTKRSALIIAVLLFVVVAIPSPMHAESFAASSLSAQAESWYYPVLPGDEKWASLDPWEAYEVCNMPEHLLKVCSTERLAELLLDYPFLLDIWAFEDEKVGLETIIHRSNIGCELFYRTDAIDVLLDSYESIPVDYLMLVSPEARTNDSIWRDSKYDEELFLQMFFGYNVNTLSLNQRGKLLSILEKKHLEKSEYYEELHFGFLFYNTVSSTLGYISEELIPDSLEQYLLMCDNADTINLSAWYADPASPDPVWFDSLHNGFNGGYYIKGYMFEYGREALCYKFYDVEYDETLKTILDNHFSSTHPALTKYSSAARAYNCHKYVWLPSYANMYWLDNPYQFYNNNPNYFQYIGNNSSAITGDNVLLYSGSDVMHSVDVSQGGTSLTTIRGVSKMHYYGVYGGTLSAHAAVYGCSSWAVYREV